jgi:hypothetical protein
LIGHLVWLSEIIGHAGTGVKGFVRC